MESITIWYLVIGTIFILVGVSSSVFQKLPVTTSIVYFVFGILLGNHGYQFIQPDLIRGALFLERLTELVVLISLFTAGLKLRLPFQHSNWIPCWRLAFVSMTITVFLIAAFSVWVLNFSWGAAILLGAILAPTDPVLASAVQVEHPEDRDRLRFSLTGEAGLNDGTAFPFVMLGLGLLGLHEIGNHGIKWVLTDVLWAVMAGLSVGWIFGTQISKLVLFLRRKKEETIILDDFLAFGLIGLTYGVAITIHAYGFLAVFAAGLAMRRIEKQPDGKEVTSSQTESKTVANAVLSISEQMERIGEVFTVIFLGAMLNLKDFLSWDLILIPVLFCLIRPISVALGLIKVQMGSYQRPTISWFGIRGIGSIYYLTYAIGKGLPTELALRLENIVYCTVVASIFIHGASGLPILNFYYSRRERVMKKFKV